MSKEDTIAIVLSPLRQALEREGITPDYLAKKLAAELEAQETKFFAHQGNVVSAQTVIDWGTRQRARMDAHKLRGDYAPEAVDFTLKESQDYSGDEEDALREAAALLAKKRIDALRNKIADQTKCSEEESGTESDNPDQS
jgi:hypothetical protein